MKPFLLKKYKIPQNLTHYSTSTLLACVIRSENALPACKQLSLCQWDPCQLHEDTSKINDVHSINLMDIMSGRLWMATRTDFFFLSACVFLSWAGEETVGIRPRLCWSTLLSRAEVGQQKTAGWWVGTMLLSFTNTCRKVREGKKKLGEEKSFPLNWGIIRACFTYLSVLKPLGPASTESLTR